MKVLKIQIHVSQTVGKVWISRKKTLPAPFGSTPAHFLWAENQSNCQILLIFLGGHCQHGPENLNQ